MPWTEEEAKKKEAELKKQEDDLKKLKEALELAQKDTDKKKNEEEEKLKKLLDTIEAEKKKKEDEAQKKKEDSILKDFPEKAKDMILELRKENAERRVKTNAVADDVAKLKQSLEDMAKQKELSDLAIAYGIDAKAMDYFKYRLEIAKLEGKLPPKEELEKIASEVNKTVSSDDDGKKGKKKDKTSTSFGPGKKPPEDDKSEDLSDLTVEEFKKLDICQESQLYHRDKETYNRLWDESKK